MFREENVIDKIEIVGLYKHIQIREANIVYRDDVEISRNYSRRVIVPGQDYSNEPSEVRSICAVVHTPEVITTYQNSLQ